MAREKWSCCESCAKYGPNGDIRITGCSKICIQLTKVQKEKGKNSATKY